MVSDMCTFFHSPIPESTEPRAMFDRSDISVLCTRKRLLNSTKFRIHRGEEYRINDEYFRRYIERCGMLHGVTVYENTGPNLERPDCKHVIPAATYPGPQRAGKKSRR